MIRFAPPSLIHQRYVEYSERATFRNYAGSLTWLATYTTFVLWHARDALGSNREGGPEGQRVGGV